MFRIHLTTKHDIFKMIKRKRTNILQTILLLILAVGCGSTLYAQSPAKDFEDRIRFGVRLGMNLGAFRGAEVRRADAHVGFIGGAGVHVPLKKLHPRLSMSAEAFFVQKAASARYDLITFSDTTIPPFIANDRFRTTVKNTATINLYTLDVPVLLKYQFISSKDYKAFVSFGGVLGIKLKDYLEGHTEVFVSEIDFPDGIGFTPQTMFQVADDPINSNRLAFDNLDYGIVIGGGTYYSVGSGRLSFDMRFHYCFPDIEKKETELRTGLFTILFGYEF